MTDHQPVSRRNLLRAGAIALAAPRCAAAAETPRAAAKGSAITIGPDTTFIDGPVGPDGYVDYAAAFNEVLSRGVTPETNGAVAYFRAVGLADIPEEHREQFLKLLGVKRLPPADPTFISMHDFKIREKLSDADVNTGELPLLTRQHEAAVKAPWQADDLPELAAWLAANEKPLTSIAASVRQPHWYVPVLQGEEFLDDLLISTMSTQREIARALEARVMLHLANADVDAAWYDAITTYHLGRVVSRRGFIVDRLVATVFLAIAYASIWQILRFGNSTLAEVDTFQKEFLKLEPLPPLSDVYRYGERFFALDFITRAARDGVHRLVNEFEFGPEPSWILKQLIKRNAGASIDWDEVLRMVNQYLDQLQDAAENEDISQQRKQVAEVNARNEKLHSREGTTAAVLLQLFAGASPQHTISRHVGAHCLRDSILGGFSGGLNAHHRSVALWRLTRVTIGLQKYYAVHKRYPARLAELQPQFVQVVPLDIFSESSFKYELLPTGYVLYSVGLDGEDDSGEESREAPPDEVPLGDIIVRMELPASHE